MNAWNPTGSGGPRVHITLHNQGAVWVGGRECDHAVFSAAATLTPEIGCGDSRNHALYDVEETLPPWPVQLVWKNVPRGLSVRS